MHFSFGQRSDAGGLSNRDEITAVPEWREPPGMLGVYVRRVKAMSGAKEASGECHKTSTWL